MSVQSPYASIENLSTLGRSMPRSDINTLEQALAKTMSRQNHPHPHNPSPVSSGTNIQEGATEAKVADQPADVPDKLRHEDDKILTDRGTLADSSPPCPTETKSEPDLSAPKVKAISRFKVETVKEDPLLQANDTENKATSPEGESSKTNVTEEKKIEKRGRFQVTKIAVKPADSTSSEGTSADATSSASGITKPNISELSDTKQDAVDPTTNFQSQGEGASDNTQSAGVSKCVIKINGDPIALNSINANTSYFPACNSSLPVCMSNLTKRGRSVSVDHLYTAEKPGVLESSPSLSRLTHVGGRLSKMCKPKCLMHSPASCFSGKGMLGECPCCATDGCLKTKPRLRKGLTPTWPDHRRASQVS